MRLSRKLTLLPLLLLQPALLFGQDAHALAGKVDQRYNRMHSLEARFTETYTGAGATRTEGGTLLIKKPGRMRWDYDTPRPKLFVTDGNMAWFYVPGEQQARRSPIKQLDDLRSPLRYLLGKSKLEKELTGLSIASNAKPLNAGGVVLRGVPRGMQDRISETLLEVAPDGAITRIRVEELDGSITDLRFLQQKEDVQVADSKFQFTPPPGVEIVTGTGVTE